MNKTARPTSTSSADLPAAGRRIGVGHATDTPAEILYTLPEDHT